MHITPLATVIGNYFVAKYRARAAQRGHFAAALQLRKQGVPLPVARLILLGGQ